MNHRNYVPETCEQFPGNCLVISVEGGGTHKIKRIMTMPDDYLTKNERLGFHLYD